MGVEMRECYTDSGYLNKIEVPITDLELIEQDGRSPKITFAANLLNVIICMCMFFFESV